MTKTLGDAIREARVKKDVGLRELARKLEVTPSYVSDIEHDRRVPSEEILKQMARFLDLSFDTLMSMAGRVGEDAERYLRRTPAAGVLFRRMSERGLSDEQVRKLLEHTERFKGGQSK